MKFINFGMLPLTLTLTVHIKAELPFYKETDHYKLYCLPVDNKNADAIIVQGEQFFKQFTDDFKHTYAQKLQVYVYPDLASFHEAIDFPTAPDWLIASHDHATSMVVSPSNPGPIHSYDSVMRSQINAIIDAFIHDMYGDAENIPYWLQQGVSLYKSGYYSSTRIYEEVAKNREKLPTLEQLENIKRNEHQSCIAFAELNGFYVSFSLVEFIVHTWGWESVLKLLDNYAAFETILGISKKEFHEKWLEFLTHYAETFSIL